jgi:hypothetical protein
MLFSKQVRHKRMHTGRGEQYGWIIVGNNRCRWDNGVLFFTKEFEEAIA